MVHFWPQLPSLKFMIGIAQKMQYFDASFELVVGPSLYIVTTIGYQQEATICNNIKATLRLIDKYGDEEAARQAYNSEATKLETIINDISYKKRTWPYYGDGEFDYWLSVYKAVKNVG